MGNIAGVFYFDGRPVPPGDMAAARAAVRTGAGARVSTHAASGLFLIGADPNGGDGKGISKSVAGNACAFDGRLDNRGELLSILGKPEHGSRSDADIALATVEVSENYGLGKLTGDWSTAIWLDNTRSVTLASDYAGVRPLYYSQTDDRILWSTSLQGLVQWIGPLPLDDQYVAGFLTWGPSADCTPYRGVSTVPAGGAVVARRNSITQSRFWGPPIGQSLTYRDEREYEEHLRQLFQEAVECRLPATGSVCAELSGGLDSSSVVSMASRLITSHKDATLHTFSYREPGSVDERFITLMEKSCGAQAMHLNSDEYPAVAKERVGEAVPSFWIPRWEEMGRRMQQVGASTCMSGQFGDLIMGNWVDDSEQVADFVRAAQFGRAVAEAFTWSTALRMPIYPILWRAVKAATLGGRASNLAKAFDQRDAAGGDCLSESFRRKTTGARRRQASLRWLKDVAPSRRKQYWGVTERLRRRDLQCPESFESLSLSHPFAHRPLVEYMLRIPAAVVCGPKEPRRLMRRAFANHLPAAVLNRRSKAAYDGVIYRSMRPMAVEMMRSPGEIQLVERGYLDRGRLQLGLARFVEGLECGNTHLVRAILLEFWLRRRS